MNARVAAALGSGPGQTSPAATCARDRFLVAWAALGVILPCLIPNFGTIALALSFVAPVVLAGPGAVRARMATPTPVIGLLALIFAYLCLNVLVAPATDNAAAAIATVGAGTVAVYLCLTAYPLLPLRDLKLMARGLAIGCLLVAGFFLFEYASRLSLQRTFQHLAEVAGFKGLRLNVGTWERPFNTHMSRNLAILVILLWSGLACLALTFEGLARRVASIALVVMVGGAAFLSPSATAKMGFVAGVAAFGLAALVPRLTAAALYVGWCVASLGCIPLAQLVHRFQLYDATWIHPSGRHRLLIWAASAEWFWKNPLLGLGIGGARITNLNADLRLSTPGIEAEPLNWHAHNSFIQMWFEAGAVGGVLLCLLGILVLRAAFRLPRTVRPFAVATFVSIFFIALTGFSLWAAWYLAAYGLAGVYVLLAVETNRA